MDNYYTKYIKYKNKYLELKKVNDGTYYTKNITEKELIGGVLGTAPCPSTIGIFGFTFGSIWSYLREYNCTYQQLLEKINDKVNAITYADFQRTNRDNKQNPLTVANLRSREFPALFLKDRGFPLDVLKVGGFTLSELKQAGFSASELKKYFILYKLKEAGFSVGELEQAGFNLYELITIGFNLQELKAHFNLKRLNMYFTLHKLKEAGVSASELRQTGFNAKELKEAGFTLEDLIRSQFTYFELLGGGIYIAYIDIDDYNKHLEDVIKRLDDTQLIMDILEGNKGENLLKVGLSIIELKRGGITAKELKDSGADPRELVDAGFTLQELKDVFNEEDDVEKFKMDKFSAKELYDAGFTLQFLYSEGRRGYSYNLDDIVQIVKKINKNEYDQVNTLIEAGFSYEDIQIYYPYYYYESDYESF
jgi:ribosomal protein L13E